MCFLNLSRQLKKLLPFFGFLDIVTLIRSYGQLIPNRYNWIYSPWITAAHLVGYFSQFFSAFYLLWQLKAGIWLAYFQFPFRALFLILSFGFFTVLNQYFQNSMEFYEGVIYVLMGLEVFRLIATIQIHRKYFWNTCL